jgi:hypothetical protein
MVTMSSPVGPTGCHSTNPSTFGEVPEFDEKKTKIIEVFDIIVSDQIWLRCHTGSCFYYNKSDIISLYYFLFQYSRRHKRFPSIDEDIQTWPVFLLLYCCHKRNVFVWLE